MQQPSDTECNLAVEEVLTIIGSKWAFLVIGHLNQGPQRFNQLKRSISQISTQSLTTILRHLEDNEVVHRQVFSTVPVTVEYSLTEKGKDFLGVLKEMREWGQKWRKKKSIPIEKD